MAEELEAKENKNPDQNVNIAKKKIQSSMSKWVKVERESQIDDKKSVKNKIEDKKSQNDKKNKNVKIEMSFGHEKNKDKNEVKTRNEERK